MSEKLNSICLITDIPNSLTKSTIPMTFADHQIYPISLANVTAIISWQLRI